MKARYSIRLVIISVFSTLGVVWLLLNLTLGDKQFEDRFSRLYDVHNPQFARTMGVILGPPQEAGNDVKTLLNGDATFKAMLDAIRAAKQSITFETYIFWSGTIGAEFVEALRKKASSGVRIHVLLDWIGGDLDERLLERMRETGIELRRYNAPHWYNLHFLNHRTHRKLLVVDGIVGFIGGVGIGDKWRGNASGPNEWRDTHFQVRGPVVSQLQAAFADNWMFASGEVLHGNLYFPKLDQAGDHVSQVFTSSPGGGRNSMQLMYLLALNAASTSIRLSAAYFIPDEVAVKTLSAAMARGVRVQIILPGSAIDRPLVRHASRALWGEILRAGAEIYEYQPTMYHVKVLIVDEFLVSAGSTNFDNRSFSINDEANLNVYDRDFARKQVLIFQQDLALSRRVHLREWENRSVREKVLDYAASLLRSQL